MIRFFCVFIPFFLCVRKHTFLSLHIMFTTVPLQSLKQTIIIHWFLPSILYLTYTVISEKLWNIDCNNYFVRLAIRERQEFVMSSFIRQFILFNMNLYDKKMKENSVWRDKKRKVLVTRHRFLGFLGNTWGWLQIQCSKVVIIFETYSSLYQNSISYIISGFLQKWSGGNQIIICYNILNVL